MANQGQALRVVVFTGGPQLEPQVVDFLGRLERDPDVELAAIISQSPIRGISGVVRDLWSRRGALALPLLMQLVARVLWRETMTPRVSRRRRRLLSELGSRTHFVTDIRATDIIEYIRDLEPMLGLVYGGPILKPELFGIPEHGTLGIHHGKVPAYRGKKTTFWAIYNGEDEVGVTIQRLGRRLDGGDVLMEGRVSVGKRPLPFVQRQLETLGLDLYLQAVHAVKNGTAVFQAQQQQSTTLYRDPVATDIIRFWVRYLMRLLGVDRLRSLRD